MYIQKFKMGGTISDLILLSTLTIHKHVKGRDN